ncbi:MAG: hypothetical protein RBS08_04590 [Bdellovibrionales bacterium]|jgi:hypothetical protein|nr:hypothetical protein [Bdellovibrionales bacterium]
MTDITDIVTSSADMLPGTENKVSVITVNFKDGDVIGRAHHETADGAAQDSEDGIPRLLRQLARQAQKDKVKSVIVLTITEDDHVDWVHVAENEHHMALAALCLDDLKDDLKSHIFSSMEEEEA